MPHGAVLRANYQALKKILAEHYDKWSKQLDRFRANAADVGQCLQNLQQKFRKQRDLVLPGHNKAFDELFSDPAKPEKALTPRFSAMKFYRRELKPVMAEGDDLKLLEPVVQLKRELFDVTFEALLKNRVSESEP